MKAWAKRTSTANIFVTMRSGGFGQFVSDNTPGPVITSPTPLLNYGPDADAAALEKKLPGFLNKYGAPALKALGMTKYLHLQPLHLRTYYTRLMKLNRENGSHQSYTILYFACIAIMIQLIACINFMNLSTARASNGPKKLACVK